MTVNYGIGDPGDPEAVADGGVIALLKRIRTILGVGVAVAAANVDEPAVNTAAVITYAAGGAGVNHVISGVAWSYDAVPATGSLTIEDGLGTTIFVVSVTAAGAGFFMFAPQLLGTANTALVVTLAAGGAAVTGKVSVMGHWTA